MPSNVNTSKPAIGVQVVAISGLGVRGIEERRYGAT